ncbi:MAG TPA: hypothetical protein VMV77_19715 [Bacteroidales bacterium]|nr:hypothetical protein [Bacteroidales bacterium]
MRYLRGQGNICAVVEKWNAYAGPHGVRQDLFGIVDILCLDPARGFVGIQACSQSSASHLRKMREEHTTECIDWLQTPGGILEVWCWRKLKVKMGGKAMRWSPRITPITLDILGEIT